VMCRFMKIGLMIVLISLFRRSSITLKRLPVVMIILTAAGRERMPMCVPSMTLMWTTFNCHRRRPEFTAWAPRHRYVLKKMMDAVRRRCCEKNDRDKDYPDGANGARPAAAELGFFTAHPSAMTSAHGFSILRWSRRR
jgi:hypothetical protein